MELKDKLKALRLERGLTQAQLAERLFVSRSTIAKWENGLGLPNAESMKLLEEQFEITLNDIATTEPEIVIVQKNRKLRLTFQIIGWTAIMLLMVGMYMLPFSIHNGDYGFTWEMAAGVFADETYIDTGDYRIYYHTFEGDWEDGRHWYSLSHFKIIEKHFWGFTVWDEHETAQHVFHGHTAVGRFYSIKGKDGYYNIIYHYVGNQIPDYIVTIESVSINGVEYEVQDGFFFITPEPVEYFEIGDFFLNVE